MQEWTIHTGDPKRGEDWQRGDSTHQHRGQTTVQCVLVGIVIAPEFLHSLNELEQVDTVDL